MRGKSSSIDRTKQKAQTKQRTKHTIKSRQVTISGAGFFIESLMDTQIFRKSCEKGDGADFFQIAKKTLRFLFGVVAEQEKKLCGVWTHDADGWPKSRRFTVPKAPQGKQAEKKRHVHTNSPTKNLKHQILKRLVTFSCDTCGIG